MDMMENGVGDIFLFDPALLNVDWESRKANFNNNISPTSPGESLKLRPLSIADYDRGYMQLLSQLTSIGDVSKKLFNERFQEMKACKSTYYTCVLEDVSTNQIIGSATLVIEIKYIHSAAKRGRIEDVVVNEEYRGKQLGKLLVETLTLLGKELDCYKMSLECKESNVKFYESFGYAPDEQYFMVQRYKH